MRFGCKERGEQLLDLALIETGSRVFDGDQNVIPISNVGAHAQDARAIGDDHHRVQCVRDQIQNHLLQLGVITPHARDCGCQSYVKRNVMSLQLRLLNRKDRVDEIVNINKADWDMSFLNNARRPLST